MLEISHYHIGCVIVCTLPRMLLLKGKTGSHLVSDVTLLHFTATRSSSCRHNGFDASYIAPDGGMRTCSLYAILMGRGSKVILK